MLPEELLKKVHRIQITTRKLVDEVLSGQFRTQFKGQGMQFSEHRVYVPGDDIRHIDWKVSARTREPMIKKFEEERELTVFLVVDISMSKNFGSNIKLKSDIAAEIAGLLAYAAIHTGDKVGVLAFAGKIEKIIPPRKGKQHILRIIREVLELKPKTQGTQLKEALDATGRIMKHSGVIFIISDFQAPPFEKALNRLSKRHDVIALSITDPREAIIPSVGKILLHDQETQREVWVDTSSYGFKKWFSQFSKTQENYLQTVIRNSKADFLSISAAKDYGEAVVQFFRTRKKGLKRI